MKRWRIEAYLPGGMGMPSYDGFIDAWGDTEEDAIEDGKARIWRVHGHREVRIKSVTRIYS